MLSQLVTISYVRGSKHRAVMDYADRLFNRIFPTNSMKLPRYLDVIHLRRQLSIDPSTYREFL
jgi:hypothetical protein